jgi:hypothetical protein
LRRGRKQGQKQKEQNQQKSHAQPEYTIPECAGHGVRRGH